MATATKKPAAKAAAKPAAKPAPAEVEATEEETAFGVSDVVELIAVRTGKTVKTRDLRILLRKMARDGRLNREIIAGNRNRWVWDGPEDPEIDAILEAFEAGELEADKREKLAALKERKNEQRAAVKAAKEAEEAEGGEEELEDE